MGVLTFSFTESCENCLFHMTDIWKVFMEGDVSSFHNRYTSNPYQQCQPSRCCYLCLSGKCANKRCEKALFFLMKRIYPLWRQAQLMHLRLCTSLQGECLESNIHTTYKQTELYLYIQQITQSLKNVNNSKR